MSGELLEGERGRSSRFFEVSQDMLCTATFDGFFERLNWAWTETLGWSEAELCSRPFVEFVHPDDRERTERETAGLAQDGVTVDFTNRYATKDGGWRWLEWRSTAVLQDGLIYASARDVTNRKLAELELEATESRAQQLLVDAQASERLLERQRRQLVEAQSVAGIGSWEWELATDTIEWSDEMSRIYGVLPGQKRQLEEGMALTHPEDRARLQAALEASLKTRKSFALEYRIVRPDGVVRTIGARGSVTDEAGQPPRMVGTAQDVTERNAAEETRGRLAELVDSCDEAIIANDLDGVIESWNRGAEALFGYTAEEAVGRPIAMLVPPERLDELVEVHARLARGERVEPLETLRVAKDGRTIEVSLRVSPLFNARRELVGFSSVSHDITHRKLLEAQLRASGRHFELSRDLAVTSSEDGFFKSVDPAVTHILGWSAEEFLARPFLDMVHPDDRASTLAEVARLADGQVTFNFTNRYLAKDGDYRWLD